MKVWFWYFMVESPVLIKSGTVPEIIMVMSNRASCVPESCKIHQKICKYVLFPTLS